MPDFKTTGGVVIAELSGVSDALKQISGMSDILVDSDVRAAYQGASKGIADSVRKVAPVSKYPYVGMIRGKTTTTRPGLLRRSGR